MHVLGGLIIFFVGLNLAEKSLKKGVGDGLKNILSLFTSNTLSGILTGLLVTAVIQSSSAVSVMVIGFISGGVMTLSQGMGVIIGSNIGTTVTLHILSLKINNLEWILCAFGLILYIGGRLNRNYKVKYSGIVCLGFGLIFLGLTILQMGVAPLQNQPIVIDWLQKFGQKPFLAILAGMVLTAFIQSSSATSGLVLTIAGQGMITLTGAIALILGSNIGTCFTALLAGIKVTRSARRLAYFHVIFNFFGVLLFIPMLKGFVALVSLMAVNLGRQIALAHTLFNLATAIAILPFIKFLEKLLTD